jgi:membrane protein
MLAAIPFLLLVLIGLSHVVQAAVEPSVTPLELLHRFLPPHELGPQDPFGVIERLLSGIMAKRGELSLYAAPAFLWFSTRLFAGIRVSLNDIYDVAVRPPPRRHFVVNWILSKLRDVGMVIATLLLVLANTVLTAGLALLQSRGAHAVPQLAFFVSTLGRVVGEFAAFGFGVALFFVVYKYASIRRLPWRTALLASVFTAVLFEVAKRLYGIYLAGFASFESSAGDATIGALVLFILWIYYTAIVFLLGAVVAETWELRAMQRKQRAILR